MKNWSKKNMSGGTLLIFAILGMNIINFIFNAYLGRVLSFETFGLVTLINTFLYIALIPFNALYATVNHKVAYLTGRENYQTGSRFLQTTLKKTIPLTLIISGLWILSIPLIDSFFRIDNFLIPLLFTPIITLGMVTAANKGFLQGNFKFADVSIIMLIEAVSKLILAWIFVNAHLTYWVYTAIPLSIFLSFLWGQWVTRYKKTSVVFSENHTFPKKFFSAALITGVSSTAFLTIDLLLAKHFLSPTQAGQYALLSLIGKMIFFFGILPNALMITFVSGDEGRNLDTKKSFYKLFSATIILSVGAFLALGVLGQYIVPFLFGNKTQAILPYLLLYCAGITLFAIASTIISYHLAKKQYIFPFIAICMALMLSVGISIFHKNITEITHVIFYTSLVGLGVTGTFHVLATKNLLRLNERWSKLRYA